MCVTTPRVLWSTRLLQVSIKVTILDIHILYHVLCVVFKTELTGVEDNC